MEQANRSKTAEIPAIMRALHQTTDEEPKILQDPIAPRLVDTTGRDQEWLAQFVRHGFAQRWRAGFVMRSRYAEDCLAEGVTRGVRQYVILGAGLDTFAYRQGRWASQLRIYEVDHPETQRWKCDRLAAAGMAPAKACVPGGSRPSCEAVCGKRCSAVVEIVSADKGGAVRYVGGVIVDDVPMSPIKSPVMPAPAKASEKSQTKTHSEANFRAGHIESGVPKPTWPYD